MSGRSQRRGGSGGSLAQVPGGKYEGWDPRVKELSLCTLTEEGCSVEERSSGRTEGRGVGRSLAGRLFSITVKSLNFKFPGNHWRVKTEK